MSAVKKPTGAPATPKPIRGRGKAKARMSSEIGRPLRFVVSGSPRTRYSAGFEPYAPHVDLSVKTVGLASQIEVRLTVDEAERLGTELVEKARAMRDAPIDELGERWAADQARRKSMEDRWKRFLAAEEAAETGAAPLAPAAEGPVKP